MPPHVADDDHKRRARRRLIGAVALTIVAVITLPLVLEDKPPPAGPLDVRMPQTDLSALNAPQNTVEYAQPANNLLEPPQPEETESTAVVKGPQPANQPAKAEKSASAPPKPVEKQAALASGAQKAVAYTVQVGVFADKANVQKLQKQITTLGFKSYTDSLDGSTRVRVGTFKARTEADKLLAKLTAAGIKGQVVEK